MAKAQRRHQRNDHFFWARVNFFWKFRRVISQNINSLKSSPLLGRRAKPESFSKLHSFDFAEPFEGRKGSFQIRTERKKKHFLKRTAPSRAINSIRRTFAPLSDCGVGRPAKLTDGRLECWHLALATERLTFTFSS